MASQEEVTEAQRRYRTPIVDLVEESGGGNITMNQTLDRDSKKTEKKAARPTESKEKK